jgi:hypothetical protein
MEKISEDILRKLYEALNVRDIGAALLLMHKDVQWSDGTDGFVKGHSGVRDFWTRQWKEISMLMTPLSFGERQDGQTEVMVLQVVKDLTDKMLSNGIVKHIYNFESRLIKSMSIQNTQSR